MPTETVRTSPPSSPEEARPEPGQHAPHAPGWRAAAVWFGIALAALFAVYAPTIVSMERIWTYNKSYAHCFFVLPLALYMIWLNRRRLASIAPEPSLWGVAAVLAFGMAWYVASVGAIQVGEHFSLIAMTIALVWAVLGGRVARAIAFPLGFLFLIVPFGEGLSPILISLAGKLAVASLHLMGIPFAYDGWYIRLENGEWRITEACSGLRFILSILTVGAVYTYTSYSRWWKRVLFLTGCVAAAVLMNAFRLWLLVMIGLYTSMQTPLVRNHVPLGWVLFAIMVIALFALGRLWMDPQDVSERPLPSARSGAVARGRPKFAGTAVLALGLAVLWPFLAGAMDRRQMGRPLPRLVAPAGVGGWTQIESMPWDWEPYYVGAKATIREAYQGPSGPVGLYVAFYRDQRQGAELIKAGNGLQSPLETLWRYTPPARRNVPAASLAVDEIDARSLGTEFRVWRWYWTGRRTTADGGTVKLDGLVSKVLGRSDDAAVVILYAPLGRGPDDASASMTRFLRDMGPGLDRMLAQAAANR